MSEPDKDHGIRPLSETLPAGSPFLAEGMKYYLVRNPKRFQHISPKFSRVLESFDSDEIVVITTIKPNRPPIESVTIMSPPKSNFISVIGSEENAKAIAEKLLDIYEAKEIRDVTTEVISGLGVE